MVAFNEPDQFKMSFRARLRGMKHSAPVTVGQKGIQEQRGFLAPLSQRMGLRTRRLTAAAKVTCCACHETSYCSEFLSAGLASV